MSQFRPARVNNLGFHSNDPASMGTRAQKSGDPEVEHHVNPVHSTMENIADGAQTRLSLNMSLLKKTGAAILIGLGVWALVGRTRTRRRRR